MNTYPSPAGEDMDSSEHYLARDGQPQQMDNDDPKAEPVGPPQEQTQTPQEPSRGDIDPHDVRELQLAAQLGQDLAGGVSSMPPVTSSEMAIDSLAATDSNLRTILPYPDAPQEAQTHHGPGQSSMSVQESESSGQMPQYEPRRQQSEQLTLAMPTSLDQLQGSGQYTAAEGLPRKRSKVSRACDECRRKKVKCDAQLDNGDAPCSSCKRSNISCQFSRVPQKRGPSKGYIKELADRIVSIEQLVQAPNEERSLKRSFSTMSVGEAASTPAPSRPAPWSSEQRSGPSHSIQPSSLPPPERYQTPYSPSELVPPITASPHQESTPSIRTGGPSGHMGESAAHSRLDADVFSGYTTAVHPHLPFLSESRQDLEAQLSQCPADLQDAFVDAFYGAVATFPTARGRSVDMGRAFQKINEFFSANSIRDMDPWQLLSSVQALVLMTIEAENRSPESQGPSKDMLLGAAIQTARRGRFNIYNAKGQGVGTTLEMLRIRTWCVIMILDRLDGVSTGCRSSIQGDFIPPSNLKHLLGPNLYHFLRFTEVLGPISSLSSLIQDPFSPQTRLETELLKMLPMMIEKERVEFPDDIEPSHFPVVHLGYWYSRLLVSLFDTDVTSVTVLYMCQSMTTLLVGNSTLLSPLTHHFTVLVALVLLKLARVDASRDEARTLLSELVNSPVMPSAWNTQVRDLISAKLARQTTSDVEQTARESLQRLADVATGGGKEKMAATATATTSEEGLLQQQQTQKQKQQYSKLGFNPMPLLHAGYICAFREMM